MPNFRKIKIFNLNSSSVWALSWSNLGNFLVSCTSDGMYFLWGKRSSAIIKNSKNKIEIERKIFQNWNCLEFSLKKKKKSTIRSCSYSVNFYKISMCSFEGIFLTTKIFFSRSKGFFFTNELTSFCFGKSEIKSSEFSPNGEYFAASSRNKNLWIWRRENRNLFEPFFVFNNHESDVKQTKWHPYFGFIVTSTYDGIMRITYKKTNELLLISSLKFSSSSILGLNINYNGYKIALCTGKGDIYVMPFFSSFFSRPKKKKKEEFFFFSFSRNTIHCIALSKLNSILSFSGDDDSLQIIKTVKIWSFSKNRTFLYKNATQNKFLEVQNSLPKAHYGFINCLAWHPRYNNFFASCGDDSIIIIWILS